jgi:sigma-B regulation protein RsbU (phosphoserine phosphatase)
VETMHVLIVDDDPDLCSVVSAYLTKAGAEVETAYNGQEALEKLESISPDVLISDLDMPVMGGMELIHRVHEDYPSVVPVILTASAARDDTIAAIKEGVFDFIEKDSKNFATIHIPVRRAAEHSQMLRERERLLRELRLKNTQLEDNLKKLRATYAELHKRGERLQDDLQRAQRIQQRMLPTALPPFGTYEFAAYYHPCDMLGGDFFDCIRIDDHRTAFYVADVSGHGVAAAMATVVLREVMHAKAKTIEGAIFFADPEQVLIFLNQALRDELSDVPVHVTMCYLVLDAANHHVLYGTAGHPAPVITDGHQCTTLPAVAGIGLGLAKDAAFETHSIEFPDGASLLVYSDGLTEAEAPDGTLVSTSTVADWLNHSAGTSALVAVDDISNRLVKHLGGNSPPDDVSFMIVRRTDAESICQQRTVVFATPTRTQQHETGIEHAHLSVGSSEQSLVIKLSGRVTWKLGAAFAAEVADAVTASEKSIMLDLAECESLDSTLLGMLCRVPPRVRVYGLTGTAETQTRELGIHDMLSLTEEAPPPVTLGEIDTSTAETQNGSMMLSAHMALAALNDENRERFADVIEILSEEQPH